MSCWIRRKQVSCLCPVSPVWSALTSALGGTRYTRSRWCGSGVIGTTTTCMADGRLSGQASAQARHPNWDGAQACRQAGSSMQAEVASSSSIALPGRTWLVATGLLGYVDRST
jgi:hypothetical protein